MIKFMKVELTPDLIKVWYPILEKHFNEVKNFEFNFKPRTDIYLELQKSGGVFAFAAYDEINKSLVGYSIFLTHIHPHYGVMSAHQDMIYIMPDYRGLGPKFVRWCDTQLEEEGIKVVYYNLKKGQGLENKLRKFGYKPIETIYAKQLGE